MKWWTCWLYWTGVLFDLFPVVGSKRNKFDRINLFVHSFLVNLVSIHFLCSAGEMGGGCFAYMLKLWIIEEHLNSFDRDSMYMSIYVQKLLTLQLFKADNLTSFETGSTPLLYLIKSSLAVTDNNLSNSYFLGETTWIKLLW